MSREGRLRRVGSALVRARAVGAPRRAAPLWTLGLSVVLVALAAVHLLWGYHVGDGGPLARQILVDIRLKRLVAATMVGATLAVSGASFQTLFRNPLADPFVLGVSGGGALGGSLAIALGLGEVWVAPAAFVGAAVATLGTWWVARGAAGDRVGLRVLLSGVVFNTFAGSVVMLMRYLSDPLRAQKMIGWLMGTLEVELLPGWTSLSVAVAGMLLGLVGLLWVAPSMNLLSMGGEQAQTMGVDAARTRVLVLVAGSLAVGSSVALAGMVGFVGLVVPNLVRLRLGPDPRLVMPVSLVAGAGFLVLSDTLSRGLEASVSAALPVGVVTSMVGAPMFLWLLNRTTLGHR